VPPTMAFNSCGLRFGGFAKLTLFECVLGISLRVIVGQDSQRGFADY
jgi:hypothetical protein